MLQEVKFDFSLPCRLSARPEAQIIAGWRSGGNAPMVSICCATYNQVQYIEDAICGFLAQETEFSFEVIIRDDASDDGTADIVLEYASRYPQIVKAVINAENEYRKGIWGHHVWPKLASGKYIAMCEGDDFWIVPNKLQKQVELLEKYQDAVMSVALTHYFQQSESDVRYVGTTVPSKAELIYFDELQRHYFHASTYLVRSGEFGEIIERYFFDQPLFGDSAMRAILITRGPFAVLPEAVSVYRITGAGVWTSIDQKRQLCWEFQATRKLGAMLRGKHRNAQRRALYKISAALCLSSLRSGEFLDGVKWGAQTFRYGAEEAMRRLITCGHRP